MQRQLEDMTLSRSLKIPIYRDQSQKHIQEHKLD